jgi:hypothetical protein
MAEADAGAALAVTVAKVTIGRIARSFIVHPLM